MAYDEKDYRTMLSIFCICHFQKLLKTFNCKDTGEKRDLKSRALRLLRNKNFESIRPKYLLKIEEIYSSIRSYSSNEKKKINNKMYNQQQRQMMSMGMLDREQRMYSALQYHQQPLNHITLAEFPQTMPKMNRGMYSITNMDTNSNMYSTSNNQYNYQPTKSRTNTTLVSQTSVSHQLNITPPEQELFHSKDATSNSNFLPPTLRLRKLPFYNIIDEAIEPIILDSQDTCTLPNFHKGMKEKLFNLYIAPQHIQQILSDHDITDGKSEYNTQLQIRICLFESGNTEITDFMPLGLHIRVNNKDCPLPPTPNSEARRISRPINCTHQMKLEPNVTNSIIINWNPDKKTYVIGMYIVKKLNSDILLQQLKDKGARSAEETKNKIIKMFADLDPDLSTTSYRFSLVCPLSKMRIKIPAKSIKCFHLQCFDVSFFILMNEHNPTWRCPICNYFCFYDDIRIESYFLDVVQNSNLSVSCKEIEILANGEWKEFDETSKDKNSEIVCNVYKNVPEYNMVYEQENSSLIDLTLSDDNETPNEMD